MDERTRYEAQQILNIAARRILCERQGDAEGRARAVKALDAITLRQDEQQRREGAHRKRELHPTPPPAPAPRPHPDRSAAKTLALHLRWAQREYKRRRALELEAD